jgi:hypothetical protein
MGWTLSSVSFRRNGLVTAVDAYGNNVAWVCACGLPLLFTYQDGKPGSASGSPKTCDCGLSYFLHPEYGTLPEPAAGVSDHPAPVMDII